jgi:hypothetical protein
VSRKHDTLSDVRFWTINPQICGTHIVLGHARLPHDLAAASNDLHVFMPCLRKLFRDKVF